MSEQTLPLTGIRVLDFTQLLQGPSATQVLADFGADVIKIERPDVGEIGRDQEPRVNGLSCYWAAANRNKRSLSLNLKDPRAIQLVYDLVPVSDIVASNFRPDVMDRLGLGHDALSAINPRIISAYASGYGRSGPYRDRRGQDLAAQAIGGVMSLTGRADGPPTPVGTFAIDYLASMHFALGMFAALAARDRTGRGQVVDASLLNSAVAVHPQEGTAYLNTGRRYPRPPAGIAHAHNTALYATYETADGRHLALIAEFYVDQPWQRISRALDLPDPVRTDPRFQSIEGLLEHQEETASILATAFRGYPLSEAMSRLEAEDLLSAPVNDHEQVFQDPQVRHNEMILDLFDARVGSYQVVGMPIKLSETPGRIRHLPPTVGEHNELILRELGLDEQDISKLKADGVIGSENDQGASGDWRWGG